VSTATATNATTVISEDTSAPAPVTARDAGAPSASQRLSTSYVLAESVRQFTRFAGVRDATITGGRGRLSGLPPMAALPVVRGLAAVRLLLGRPGRVEQALLSALIAGVGTLLSAGPGPEESTAASPHVPRPGVQPYSSEALGSRARSLMPGHRQWDEHGGRRTERRA
jgi:hypothetical protein